MSGDRIRRFAAGAAMLVATLAVSGALLEAGVRLTGMQPSSMGPPRFAMVSDPDLGFRLSPDAVWHVATSEVDFTVRTNRYGFRGGEWSVTAPSVVFLGSSETFGWGTEGEATFPALVQERLNEAGVSVEVHDLGVFGYNLHQIESLTRTWAHPAPRAIVLGVSWLTGGLSANDTAFRVIDGFFVERNRFPDGRPTLLYRAYALAYSHSRAAAVVIDRLRILRHGGVSAPAVPEITDNDRQTAEAIARHVRRIRDLVPGSPFAVLIGDDLPYDLARFRLLAESLRAAEIEVIDTLEPMLAAGQASRYPRDGHWNELGHRIVAGAVWEWLEPQLTGSAR